MSAPLRRPGVPMSSAVVTPGLPNLTTQELASDNPLLQPAGYFAELARPMASLVEIDDTQLDQINTDTVIDLGSTDSETELESPSESQATQVFPDASEHRPPPLLIPPRARSRSPRRMARRPCPQDFPRVDLPCLE